MLILLTIFGYAGDVVAQYRMKSQPRLYVDRRGENTISPSRAKQIAEDRFGGQALSATKVDGGSAGSVYRVKIIKAGRVKVVTIPANPE